MKRSKLDVEIAIETLERQNQGLASAGDVGFSIRNLRLRKKDCICDVVTFHSPDHQERENGVVYTEEQIEAVL